MYAFFERLLNPFPAGEPQTPPKNLWAFCRHYARGAEKYIVGMGVLTALLAVLEVTLNGCVGKIVDWLNHATPGALFDGDEHHILFTTIGIALLIPFTILFQSLLMHQTLLGNFPMAIRWNIHRYLLGHSLSFYHQEFAGRLATKLMQTSLAVRETIIKLVDVMLYVSIYFLSSLVLVFSFDWRLALPFLVWLGVYCLLLRYFLPRLAEVAERQADARALMTGRIVDTYTNIPTVKLFSHDQRESGYAKESMTHFLQAVYPQMRLATALTSAVWTASGLLSLGVLITGVWLWNQQALTSGAIAVAGALALRMIGMSHWIMWEVSALFENVGTVRDGINTLSQPRDARDRSDARALALGGGELCFEQVHFAYQDNKKVLADINLHIRPGEKVGLVGRSGAGKSTLVNLLLRFYELHSGCIRIDGQDIADLTQNSLRANIAMVTQDTSLLHRSVRENIAYGRPEASDDEIITAARQASAHEFILGLCDSEGRRGYDAHVGERGVTLSGGQRQRIAIARVLLKNAPILILDEATSALDSEIEQIIQQNLAVLMQDKTVIAIAHRLSTIAQLDRLIVIEQGRIVEQGSHAELLSQGGIYAQLWARQTGGYLGDDLENSENPQEADRKLDHA